VIFAALLTPVLGAFMGSRPAFRVPIAIGFSVATVAAWLVLILALGDHPPTAYVVTLFVVMTLGGPMSMSAFAVTRDYNSAETLGTASGLVNVGGFSATIVIVLGMGWVLNLQGGTDPHSLRLAALVAVVVQAYGAFRAGVWLLRGRAESLRRMALGETPPVPVIRRRWDLAPPAAALDQQTTPW
jgi:hypothetical protein